MELKWNHATKSACDDGDRYAEIKAISAGTFHFYISQEDAVQGTG